MTTIQTTLTCAPSDPFPYAPNVRVLFTLNVADISSVSSSEMQEAVDTTTTYCLVGIRGWEVDSDVVTDPNWGVFLSQRPGALSAREAALTYAAVPDGTDIRSLLSRGKRGYIMILPAGDMPGAVMNVYPVWVAQARQRQRLRENASLVDVQFALRRRPAENVIIPGAS